MSVDDINNDEGHWIDRIDRGGLWHVNENTFTLFFIIEVEIRHHFTERVPENNDEKKKKYYILYIWMRICNITGLNAIHHPSRKYKIDATAANHSSLCHYTRICIYQFMFRTIQATPFY